jgi:hypothetical protein
VADRMTAKKYREEFVFPDGGKAIAFGNEHTIQVNYSGNDVDFVQKFMEAAKGILRHD